MGGAGKGAAVRIFWGGHDAGVATDSEVNRDAVDCQGAPLNIVPTGLPLDIRSKGTAVDDDRVHQIAHGLDRQLEKFT